MVDRKDAENQSPKARLLHSRSTNARQSVPDRHDFSERLKMRLERFNPRTADREPVTVLFECVAGAQALRPICPWWSALSGASDRANPALSSDALLPFIEDTRPGTKLQILLVWQESGQAGTGRSRELIAFVPFFRPAFVGLALPRSVSWRSDWWPSGAPLVHRRYQAQAAHAILNWMATRPAHIHALILRDIDAASVFARSFETAANARISSAGHQQLCLTTPVLSDTFAGERDPNLLVLVGRDAPATRLDASIATLAVWSRGTPGGRVFARASHANLTAPGRRNRLTIVEATRDGNPVASAMALTTGSVASIVALAGDPRLDRPTRDTERDRALKGLIQILESSGRIESVEAPPGVSEGLHRYLSERRKLIDITIARPAISAASDELAPDQDARAPDEPAE